ncbi:MAG: hypothetical protein HC856_10820 [Pseudanabaena sp. RU_4_16]|nr:hypothetical protein [Pseudanabaena sp. RU_4_16]
MAHRLGSQTGKAFGSSKQLLKVSTALDALTLQQRQAQAFYPPRKVNSTVMYLLPRSPIRLASDPEFLGKLIEMGFATQRKMLRNNLGSAIDRDRLVSLLEEMGINPQVRAEDLSVEEWVALSNSIAAKIS